MRQYRSPLQLQRGSCVMSSALYRGCAHDISYGSHFTRHWSGEAKIRASISVDNKFFVNSNSPNCNSIKCPDVIGVKLRNYEGKDLFCCYTKQTNDDV